MGSWRPNERSAFLMNFSPQRGQVMEISPSPGGRGRFADIWGGGSNGSSDPYCPMGPIGKVLLSWKRWAMGPWRQDGSSGFLDELLSTAGAGNGNLSLPPGDADGLPAFRAAEVAVVPIFQAIQQLKEPPVFLVPLGLVSREHTKQHKEHGDIGQKTQPTIADEQAGNAQNEIKG